MLASISTTYYTYLEQGRELRPSREVLDALASALHLTAAERRHVHEITHGSPAPGSRGAPAESASEATVALVARMDPFPTYVKGPRWDLLAANRSARALFGDWSVAAGETPNMLAWMFTESRARTTYGDWATEARRMLARFRMAAARRPEDPGFHALTERLRADSTEFAEWWERHEVLAPSSGRKDLVDAELGPFAFDHVVMHLADDPDQTLVTFTPRGGDRDRLDRLAARVTG